MEQSAVFIFYSALTQHCSFGQRFYPQQIYFSSDNSHQRILLHPTAIQLIVILSTGLQCSALSLTNWDCRVKVMHNHHCAAMIRQQQPAGICNACRRSTHQGKTDENCNLPKKRFSLNFAFRQSVPMMANLFFCSVPCQQLVQRGEKFEATRRYVSR